MRPSRLRPRPSDAPAPQEAPPYTSRRDGASSHERAGIRHTKKGGVYTSILERRSETPYAEIGRWCNEAHAHNETQRQRDSWELEKVRQVIIELTRILQKRDVADVRLNQ